MEQSQEKPAQEKNIDKKGVVGLFQTDIPVKNEPEQGVYS